MNAGHSDFRVKVLASLSRSGKEVGEVTGRPEGSVRGKWNNNDNVDARSYRLLGTHSVQPILFYVISLTLSTTLEGGPGNPHFKRRKGRSREPARYAPSDMSSRYRKLLRLPGKMMPPEFHHQDHKLMVLFREGHAVRDRK